MMVALSPGWGEGLGTRLASMMDVSLASTKNLRAYKWESAELHC